MPYLVTEDSDWLSGSNIVSRRNQIKAKQQALGSDGFKYTKSRDSPKVQRIDKMGTTRYSQEKDGTTATTNKASRGNYIIRRKVDTKASA